MFVPQLSRLSRLLVILALAGALAHVTGASASTPSGHAPALAACAEDDPCFTWSTMGNLSRGVTLRPSRAAHRYADYIGATRLPWGGYLVDAGIYCRLEHRRYIDHERTPTLKGDYLARTKGCDPRVFAQPAILY